MLNKLFLVNGLKSKFFWRFFLTFEVARPVKMIDLNLKFKIEPGELCGALVLKRIE